jgi:phosphoribosylamine--glycine ligase
MDWLKHCSYPVVLKADGLAAGKGVAICTTYPEAKQFIIQTMSQKVFGDAGRTVIAEDFLDGEEASFLVLTDGTHWVPLASERGPNTGGMGAYSPAPVFTPEIQKRTEIQVVKPLLREMTRRGTPFVGILYVGVMITSRGPRVLEFNVRFGDPETQAILPRLDSDLAELFLIATRGRLDSQSVRWKREATMTVVLASKGYPASPQTGADIRGVEIAERNALVFHSGTRWVGERLVTSGGRVFSVTGIGDTLQAAREKAYEAVLAIEYEGKIFRRDIGWRAL